MHPVINKADLPTADIARTREQISSMIGLDGDSATVTSAKIGTGVDACLDAVIEHLPSPTGSFDGPLKALVFDSYFDLHRGVVLLIRVFHGVLRRGDTIVALASIKAKHKGSSKIGTRYTVDGIGVLTPEEKVVSELRVGEIGFVTAAIRGLEDVAVGCHIMHANDESLDASREALSHEQDEEEELALRGYESQKPLVFCGVFPTDANDFASLRKALDKLQLQDGSLWFEVERCGALGSGFRCGFLGLLHLSVTLERLEREFGVPVMSSAPSVPYRVQHEDWKEWREISNPAEIPNGRVRFQELFANVDILCANDNVGAMVELLSSRRGILKDQAAVGTERMRITAEVPISEVVTDLHDSVKSRSAGFASMAYDITDFRASRMMRLDIRVAGESVAGLASVVHEDRVQRQARRVVETLRDVIPRQMFKVAIQAIVQGKVIASEHIAAFRKDVTAKCYGGDASRKKKLLKKQAEGKKRMKTLGKVAIPQEAFLAVLKKDF